MVPDTVLLQGAITSQCVFPRIDFGLRYRSTASHEWSTQLSPQSDNLVSRSRIQGEDLLPSHSHDLCNQVLLTGHGCLLLRWRWISRLLHWGRSVLLRELRWVSGVRRLRCRTVLGLRGLRNWRRHWLRRGGIRRVRWWSCSLYDLAKHASVDQSEQEKSLEHGVGELWCLAEELSCLAWVGHDKAFHLRNDVEQLRRWNSTESLGNGIRGRQSRWNVNSGRKRWQHGWLCLDVIELRLLYLLLLLLLYIAVGIVVVVVAAALRVIPTSTAPTVIIRPINPEFSVHDFVVV